LSLAHKLILRTFDNFLMLEWKNPIEEAPNFSLK
jgi:hypothetical protein